MVDRTVGDSLGDQESLIFRKRIIFEYKYFLFDDTLRKQNNVIIAKSLSGLINLETKYV